MYLHLIREAKSIGKRCRPECDPFCNADLACRYAYGFDDIGNRETSYERGTNMLYAVNALNQYVSITNLTSDAGLQNGMGNGMGAPRNARFTSCPASHRLGGDAQQAQIW